MARCHDGAAKSCLLGRSRTSQPFALRANSQRVNIAYGICRWLLAKGAEMGVTDNGGCTALHWAAIGGEWTTARELVAKGASVNAKTLASFPARTAFNSW